MVSIDHSTEVCNCCLQWHIRTDPHFNCHVFPCFVYVLHIGLIYTCIGSAEILRAEQKQSTWRIQKDASYSYANGSESEKHNQTKYEC